MKIDLGNGAYLEPNEEPRQGRYYKMIVSHSPIAGTKTGKNVLLSCGHHVQTFGNLELAKGFTLCTQCRDREERDAVRTGK